MNKLFNTRGKDTNGTPVVRFCDITKELNTYFYCSPLPIQDLTIDHNFLSQPHKHDFYEIIWIKEGQGIHKTNHDEYEIKPNTILFLEPNTIHSFSDTKNISGFYLVFTQNFFLHISQKITTTLDSYIHDRYNGNFSCQILNSPIIERDFEMIKKEYDIFKSSETNNFYYTVTLISLLLMDVIRYGKWDETEDIPLHDISYKKYRDVLKIN